MNTREIQESSMLKSLAKRIFENWHFMRWLRLGLGLFVLWQVIQRPDVFTGFVAAFFLFQAIADVGCCGAGSCAVRPRPDNKTHDEVQYEEVKQDSHDRTKDPQ